MYVKAVKIDWMKLTKAKKKKISAVKAFIKVKFNTNALPKWCYY